MKTDAQILNEIERVKERDWMGTMTSGLVIYLPFTSAQPFLKDGITSDTWEPLERSQVSIKLDMRDYMPFAWEKANDRRGISAGRSLEHMSVWLFMLGRDAAARQMDHYSHYGKPQLRAICEAFGWAWRDWDNGNWMNSEEDTAAGPPETGITLA